MAVAEEPGAGPAMAVTTLPTTPPTKPSRPRSFWVACTLVVLLLAAAIAIPLTLRGGSSAGGPAAVATRGPGIAPRSPVFAQSDAAVAADTTALALEARALLTGTLPAATLGTGVRAALSHPPTAAAGGAPVLSASLTLTDPQLPACVSSLTGGAALYGIDRIRYAGQLSLFVITADPDTPQEALGYVIGPGCAAPGSGIRKVVTVPLTG